MRLGWSWRTIDDGRSPWKQRGRATGRGREEGRLGRLLDRNRRLWGNHLRTKTILLTGVEKERKKTGKCCKCMYLRLFICLLDDTELLWDVRLSLPRGSKSTARGEERAVTQ